MLLRLRQRIVPPPWGVGRGVWLDVDEPSLAHHVRWIRRWGATSTQRSGGAEPDAAALFHPARPPWTLTVVDGLDDARAVVLHFHHALTDGVGGVAAAYCCSTACRHPTGVAAPDHGPPPSTPRIDPLKPSPTARHRPARDRRRRPAALHPHRRGPPRTLGGRATGWLGAPPGSPAPTGRSSTGSAGVSVAPPTSCAPADAAGGNRR